MMPFRIFEFAVGASLVDVERHWQRIPAFVSVLTGILETVMLTAALAGFDGRTPWPSAWTVVPAVSTALFILAGGHGFWRGILGHGIPRFVGRISYSLYLVHWPLITLYRGYTI